MQSNLSCLCFQTPKHSVPSLQSERRGRINNLSIGIAAQKVPRSTLKDPKTCNCKALEKPSHYPINILCPAVFNTCFCAVYPALFPFFLSACIFSTCFLFKPGLGCFSHIFAAISSHAISTLDLFAVASLKKKRHS